MRTLNSYIVTNVFNLIAFACGQKNCNQCWSLGHIEHIGIISTQSSKCHGGVILFTMVHALNTPDR